MPLVMLIAVVVLVALAYEHFSAGPPSASGSPSPARKATASASPSVSLGTWRHIASQADDPTPLTLTELFPASYGTGVTAGARTVDQGSGANCAAMVIGAQLQTALRKAGCTQVMRASYLSSGQKIMGTIGVLNLSTVAAAQDAGKAAGAADFIKQLPGPNGPTSKLAQGTGLEEAQYRGHYLILTWAEFTNLAAPSVAGQKQLDAFSRELVDDTANISLTSRMVFGKPETPGPG